MSDKEFAGDQSGIAIAYKLIGFEFIVSEMEIYFRQGLEKRFDFYLDILGVSSSVDKDAYEQIIVMNRNLPVDAEAKLRIAAMLQGLGYSAEAVSRFIPESIVKEKLEEIETEPIDRTDNDIEE